MFCSFIFLATLFSWLRLSPYPFLQVFVPEFDYGEHDDGRPSKDAPLLGVPVNVPAPPPPPAATSTFPSSAEPLASAPGTAPASAPAPDPSLLLSVHKSLQSMFGGLPLNLSLPFGASAAPAAVHPADASADRNGTSRHGGTDPRRPPSPPGRGDPRAERFHDSRGQSDTLRRPDPRDSDWRGGDPRGQDTRAPLLSDPRRNSDPMRGADPRFADTRPHDPRVDPRGGNGTGSSPRGRDWRADGYLVDNGSRADDDRRSRGADPRFDSRGGPQDSGVHDDRGRDWDRDREPRDRDPRDREPRRRDFDEDSDRRDQDRRPVLPDRGRDGDWDRERDRRPMHRDRSPEPADRRRRWNDGDGNLSDEYEGGGSGQGRRRSGPDDFDRRDRDRDFARPPRNANGRDEGHGRRIQIDIHPVDPSEQPVRCEFTALSVKVL